MCYTPAPHVPVIYKEADWVALSTGERRWYATVIDLLLNNPALSRLYWALAKNDAETRLALQRSPGLRRLLPFAPVLDFYGSQICIRSGRVIVPGEARAEPGWKDLVGASPEPPGDFVTRLLQNADGWL